MGIFAIQQRVRVVDNLNGNFAGATGTITKIQGSMVKVKLDKVPQSMRINGKISLWFTVSEIEAIEDEPIEKEEQELQELKEDRSTLKSEEYIALELVKAWGSQMGQPAEIERFVDNYLFVLEALNKVQEEHLI